VYSCSPPVMKPAVEGIVTYVQLNDSLLGPIVPPVIENVVGLAASGTNPASALPAAPFPFPLPPDVVFDDEQARESEVRTTSAARGGEIFTAQSMP
jgi:hypothetical protein